MDNGERWERALERIEERTGVVYHGSPCECSFCQAIEREAEKEMADMLATECDISYDTRRDA